MNMFGLTSIALALNVIFPVGLPVEVAEPTPVAIVQVTGSAGVFTDDTL